MGAPHKPILLLSILELMNQGAIRNNRIEVSPQLLETFKQYWGEFVYTKHDPRFALPFYHLKGDGFWHLQTRRGYEKAVGSKRQIRSMYFLEEAIAYASFDTELFLLLEVSENRLLFQETSLQRYFPQRPSIAPNLYLIVEQALQDIEKQRLAESAEQYRRCVDACG